MVRQNRCGRQMKLSSDQRMIWLALVVGVSLTGAQSSAQTRIPIAPQPVGSGARALGQSAFIAVADDATAASWNPAGLINLERPEASFVGLWRTMGDDLASTTAGTSLDANTRSEWEINFMSYAQPVRVGNSDVVLSLNYHQVYDLGLEWSITKPNFREETVSKGAISAYSLAGGFAIPSHPNIAIGASFNWYVPSLHNDTVRWSERTSRTTKVLLGRTTTFDTVTNEKLDGLSGHNFTFGLLWDAYESQEKRLTLGLVCQTPFTARLDQQVVITEPDGSVTNDSARLDIDFPLSLGAGVNYRFRDEVSAAFDLQWTDWPAYTGAGVSPSSDALAARLGFERLWFSAPALESVHALRGGVFYEPRPAWSDILAVYGFSLGAGWTKKERFSVDFAYQFRWGEENIKLESTEFDYGIEEHWLISSIIIYY